jgi:hypothetical protein
LISRRSSSLDGNGCRSVKPAAREAKAGFADSSKAATVDFDAAYAI